ncbi:hypothetical protein HanIR_Chr11g0539601 [Helianthus annuus]|nr:hypothetical protein HanIR_Chr11g0539601 [Helianthus annuus]
MPWKILIKSKQDHLLTITHLPPISPSLLTATTHHHTTTIFGYQPPNPRLFHCARKSLTELGGLGS